MSASVRYIETTAGLPNTCAGCGKPAGPTWWAANDDQAIAGQGFHPDPDCLPAGVETSVLEPPESPQVAETAGAGAKTPTTPKKTKSGK